MRYSGVRSMSIGIQMWESNRPAWQSMSVMATWLRVGEKAGKYFKRSLILDSFTI